MAAVLPGQHGVRPYVLRKATTTSLFVVSDLLARASMPQSRVVHWPIARAVPIEIDSLY